MMPEGMVAYPSGWDARQTMDRLVAAVIARGMTVFARIDHAAGALAAGLELRPTEVIIFGQAKGGTPLIQAAQTSGIDLPLKALCWQDEAGIVWLGYNDPVWLAHRHGAKSVAVSIAIQAMTKVLAAMTHEACSL